MTRVFRDDGSVVPVSVIEATPNSITRLRTTEQDGYTALQLGAGSAKRVTKPVAGQFKALPREQQQPRHVREVRVESTDGFEVGQQLDVSLFAPGPRVDRRGPHAGARLQGDEDGGSHGRRPGHRQATDRRTRGQRAQPASRQGGRPRRPQRTPAGPEGEVTMAQTKVLSSSGKEARSEER